MRITITPLDSEFEAEDDFTEFIATQFPVGTQVRVSADGVVWDGTIEEVDEESSTDFDEIAEQQGWNADSLLAIMRGFISENGMSEALGKRAREIADEENGAWS